MARKRTQPAKRKLTKEDLVYIACLFEATMNIRGVGTTNAIAIGATEHWPKKMAETYGGHAAKFTSNAGKEFWGWYLPVADRLELFKAAEPYFRGMPQEDRDKIEAKLDRAVTAAQTT